MWEAGSDLCWLANGTHRSHGIGMWLPPAKSLLLYFLFAELHFLTTNIAAWYHPLPIFLQQHRADNSSDKSFEYKTLNKSNAVFNKLLESPCVYNKAVQEEANNSPPWQNKSPKTLAVLVGEKYQPGSSFFILFIFVYKRNSPFQFYVLQYSCPFFNHSMKMR
jgi:hypothetical protein